MITTDDDVIVDALGEVLANEDDPEWERWGRDRMRLQARIQELGATNLRLACQLHGARAASARATARTQARADGQEATSRSGGSAAWWTKQEVAGHLRISVRTLERMMEDSPQGVPVPWRKVGRSVRWRASSVHAWIDNLNRPNRKPGRR